MPDPYSMSISRMGRFRGFLAGFRGFAGFGDRLRNPEILESFEACGALTRQMARFARVVAPGCWHHVTQRGNRRQTVFFSDDDRAV